LSNATFVLMNCDLVAVPLQLERAGMVTIYCGPRRASQLLDAAHALISSQSLGGAAQRLQPPLHNARREAAPNDRL
jgi:hypothetical protein